MEHEKFLQGLETHGQGAAPGANVWGKIAATVGTKSAPEVKAYAHDYFIKLQAESYTARDVSVYRPCVR